MVSEMFKAGIVLSLTDDDLNQKLKSLNLNDKQEEEEENSNNKLRQTLLVQQVKILDSKGNLKSVYPSKVDLLFDGSNKFKVNRLYSTD
jgi:hypothetical protein